MSPILTWERKRIGAWTNFEAVRCTREKHGANLALPPAGEAALGVPPYESASSTSYLQNFDPMSETISTGTGKMLESHVNQINASELATKSMIYCFLEDNLPLFLVQSLKQRHECA